MKVNDQVRVGGGDHIWTVKAIGAMGRDVYVVATPETSIGTWVGVDSVALVEMEDDEYDVEGCSDDYPEHDTRDTYAGEDGVQWECVRCGAEGWEPAEGDE